MREDGVASEEAWWRLALGDADTDEIDGEVAERIPPGGGEVAGVAQVVVAPCRSLRRLPPACGER